MDATRYPNAPEDWVGVRELRQNLSVYLERVVAGEVLRVTDRGRPVSSVGERLAASGRARPARRDVLGLGRPTGRTKRPLDEALREVRDDRL